MLFSYNPDLEHPRTSWRPDLIPDVIAWIAGIPVASIVHLHKVRVTSLGGFEAAFVKDGYEVLFRFDDIDVMSVTCGQFTRFSAYIVPFLPEQLDTAIEIASDEKLDACTRGAR
jgi:hypothetical protein